MGMPASIPTEPAAAPRWSDERLTEGSSSAPWSPSIPGRAAPHPPSGRLAVDDHGDGFLHDPGLYVTHDFGLTWQAQPVDGAVTAVAALGASVWRTDAVCAAPGTPASPCQVSLRVSFDEGASGHRRQHRPTSRQYRQACQPTHRLRPKTWLVRTGPTSGYPLAPRPILGTGAADSASLWKTINNGRT